jgi:hypothetical protein
MYPNVPENPSGWRQFAKKFYTTDLHSLKPEDLSSGSKVEPIQYAAFRALWKKRPPIPFHDDLFGGLEIRRAKDMLGQNEAWNRYLAAVEHDSPPSFAMGPFSIALTTQRQASKTVKAEGRPKIDNTLPRTRFQTAMAARESAAPTTAAAAAGGGVFDSPAIVRPAPVTDQFIELDTPVGGAGPPGRALAALSARPVPFALTMTPMTPASNVALGAHAFPAVDDESIVNKALVDFLQAITMVAHENGSVKQTVQWSTRRAAFSVSSSARELYVAQVDGQLVKSTDGTSSQPLPSEIILEVKPNLRADTPHTRYQETAQMVAWISDEHPSSLASSSKADEGPFRYFSALCGS